MSVPNPCWIYRIVHIGNLPGLLAEGGIWCGNEMLRRKIPYVQIGNQELTANRSGKRVTVGPMGTLNDYVPFYFCPRSVMLYQIHTGKVHTYVDGQDPVIHLVTSVENVINTGGKYVFTDSMAKTNMAKQYSDIADLDQVDWDVIRAPDFRGREDQPDRTQRKMAEFLVHSFVPWDCIKVIGVYSKRWKDDCLAILSQYQQHTTVDIRTGWYF